MSEHRSNIVWERGAHAFGYDSYSREHRVTMGTGLAFQASAGTDFRGDGALTNPEELFVAALSGCHMLTFLAICARKKIVVDHYEDDAVGHLERPTGAQMQVTRVTLRPKVKFESEPPSAEELRSLHEQAHKGCFIASSVKTVVTVEPTP
jgi:organic hydroperoxide reductase OsmC/OhrA